MGIKDRAPGRGGTEKQLEGEIAQPAFAMLGSVVVLAGTEKRHMHSASDLGIFDKNPGITERRAATIPARRKSFQKVQR